MLRKEAEKLIGTSVTAWTSANGVYVGVLEEVKGSPWRGSVRITGVLDTPTPWEARRISQRKCLEVGRLIEVGGTNIKPNAEGLIGFTPIEAWRAKLAVFQGYTQEHERWWVVPSIREIEKRIAELEA
jgi:hypothetical protein